jgi:hypothetical protein
MVPVELTRYPIIINFMIRVEPTSPGLVAHPLGCCLFYHRIRAG